MKVRAKWDVPLQCGLASVGFLRGTVGLTYDRT
jgi:hypothetical protein